MPGRRAAPIAVVVHFPVIQNLKIPEQFPQNPWRRGLDIVGRLLLRLRELPWIQLRFDRLLDREENGHGGQDKSGVHGGAPSDILSGVFAVKGILSVPRSP